MKQHLYHHLRFMITFDDTIWVLLQAHKKGLKIPKLPLNKSLRQCDKKLPAPTSKEAFKKTNLDIIESYSKKPKGIYLEHLIEVDKRVNHLIDLVHSDDFITKEEVFQYIVDSFDAVYKIEKLEPLGGDDARIYLRD